MIDHITFGVVDYARSIAFYDQAFAPLGVKRLVEVPKKQTNGVKVAGYGDHRPWFWISEENATTGLFHVALRANKPAVVDAFYAAAMRAGGIDNGPPGARLHYHANYYGAFVLDPDGHNIEAVCHEAQT